MAMIKAGIRNEWVKLWSMKKYTVFLLLVFVLSLAGGFYQGFGNTPFTVLSVLTRFILPLIIALGAADLFTAEQENGTIKASLIRPISRMSIYLSKVLTLISYILCLLLVSLITSLIWYLLSNPFGITSIFDILIAYAVSIIPMLPITLFTVMVSLWAKNSSSTVMLSVLGYGVLMAISIILPSTSQLLFTSYTAWYKLFIGATMPLSHLINVFVLLLSYLLIFFAVSLWMFEKKEHQGLWSYSWAAAVTIIPYLISTVFVYMGIAKSSWYWLVLEGVATYLFG